MLDATEELKKYASRRLLAWQQNDITLTETVSWFLNRFALALWENPEARAMVAAVIGSLPREVLLGIMERLDQSKSPSGVWRWPPGGQPLTYPVGPGPWSEANQEQLAALGQLAGLLGCGGHVTDG
jgi:hypothetical protein